LRGDKDDEESLWKEEFKGEPGTCGDVDEDQLSRNCGELQGRKVLGERRGETVPEMYKYLTSNIFIQILILPQHGLLN
jgi:hypothetical protein